MNKKCEVCRKLDAEFKVVIRTINDVYIEHKYCCTMCLQSPKNFLCIVEQ